MAKQEILEQVEQNFGLVPDFMGDMPEPVLEQYWTTLNWVMSDTRACRHLSQASVHTR